jgi:hypothetical protein
METSNEKNHRLLDEPPRLKSSLSNERAIAVRDVTDRKQEIDKRSLDYILRSGLAGGFAGCAVGLCCRTWPGLAIADVGSRLRLLSVPLTG